MDRSQAYEKGKKLVEAGFRVLPVRANDKSAMLTAWQHNAAFTVEQWEHILRDTGSNCLVAVIPGPHYVVLDPDNDEGEVGEDSLARLGPDETYNYVTGSNKGRHLWYRKPTTLHVKNDNQKWREDYPNLNVHADRGYIVIWPDADEFVEGLGRVVELPQRILHEFNRAGMSGADTSGEACRYDEGLVDSETLRSVKKMEQWGWEPYNLIKGTEYDPERYQVRMRHTELDGHASRGANVGWKHPGYVHVYTTSWIVTGGTDIDALEELINQQRIADPEGAATGESFKDRFRKALMSLDEIEALEPPEFLIDDYLVKDSLAELFADRGVGKSFVALDWAFHVATGKPWQGHEVEPGGVFYIIGEGQAGFGKRVKAWKQYHDMQDNEKFRQFQLLAMPVNFFESEQFVELYQAIKESKPALVVIDTLARMTAGRDENASKDMGVFVQNCDVLRRASGACVLIVHHVGHTEKDRARGSSAIGAAIDTELALKGNGLDLVLRNPKQKDGPEAEDLPLRRMEIPLGIYDKHGKELTSCVIVSGNEGDMVDEGFKVTPAMEKDLNILKSIQIGGEPVSMARWKDAAGIIKGKNSGSFEQRVKRLVEEGIVTKNGAGRGSTYWTDWEPVREDKQGNPTFNIDLGGVK